MSRHWIDHEALERRRALQAREAVLGLQRELVAAKLHRSLMSRRERGHNEPVAKRERERIEGFKGVLARENRADAIAGWQETLTEAQARLEHALRNIAVLDHPDTPHTRHPETDTVIFSDDDEIWFRMKYL